MIDKQELLGYLRQIDEQLKKKVTLVAVGGTAMTLYGLKEATKDVDFCAPTKDGLAAVQTAAKKVKSDFRLDLFTEGYIYILQLPEDYITKSRPVKEPFRNLTVRLLSPIDIILTKASRLNERDLEDIRALVSRKRINKNKLIERYDMVKNTYAGSNVAFQNRFEQVLKAFFSR